MFELKLEGNWVHVTDVQEDRIVKTLPLVYTQQELDQCIGELKTLTKVARSGIHANDLFRADGTLQCLGLYRHHKGFRWQLSLPRRPKKSFTFDQVHARRQIDEMVMRISIGLDIPDDSITQAILKHAITLMVKQRNQSGYVSKRKLGATSCQSKSIS